MRYFLEIRLNVHNKNCMEAKSIDNFEPFHRIVVRTTINFGNSVVSTEKVVLYQLIIYLRNYVMIPDSLRIQETILENIQQPLKYTFAENSSFIKTVCWHATVWK